jgi:Family of unknown function (DUF5343)
MALADSYTNAIGRIPDLFAKIKDGQAPEIFTSQLLKDWGFTSSNDRAALPLLKALGFLSPDGKPTSRYHEYRNHSRSKIIMAQALRDAYGDIFLIKENPSKQDREAIEGKFKSFHNASDNVAGLMAKTFFALLEMADLRAERPAVVNDQPKSVHETTHKPDVQQPILRTTGLHYNIQIHLPPTKDVEVYNAIFRSIKEHLLDE